MSPFESEVVSIAGQASNPVYLSGIEAGIVSRSLGIDSEALYGVKGAKIHLRTVNRETYKKMAVMNGYSYVIEHDIAPAWDGWRFTKKEEKND